MEESGSEGNRSEEYTTLLIPRGGPIFVPQYIGALTRVPEFENSVVQLLEELKAEVSFDSPVGCDGDLSVDELKIFNDEELVEMAMREALPFADNEAPIDITRSRLEDGAVELDARKESSAGRDEASPQFMSVNDSDPSFESKMTSEKGKKRKGKREKQRALEVYYPSFMNFESPMKTRLSTVVLVAEPQSRR